MRRGQVADADLAFGFLVSGAGSLAVYAHRFDACGRGREQRRRRRGRGGRGPWQCLGGRGGVDGVMSSSAPPLATSGSKVLVIAGPTAVGKSAAALQLAEELDGEIISADSVQVYRYLDVGANKPSAEERERVHHHLIDVADPVEVDYTAGQYFYDSRAATQDVQRRHKVPIVVGGTSMYLRWFVYGKPPTEEVSGGIRRQVERDVDATGGDWSTALSILEEVDAIRAKQLTRNDWYRLKRSLEVARSGQGTVSELPDVGGAPGLRDVSATSSSEYDFRCFFIAPSREELARTVDLRCERMLAESGLIMEVVNLLLEQKLRLDSSPAKAIGYRQTVDYLLARARALDAGRDAMEAFRGYLDVSMTAQIRERGEEDAMQVVRLILHPQIQLTIYAPVHVASVSLSDDGHRVS